jgi:hypothetical protein
LFSFVRITAGTSSEFLGINSLQDSNVNLFENVKNRVKCGLNKSNIYYGIFEQHTKIVDDEL